MPTKPSVNHLYLLDLLARKFETFVRRFPRRTMLFENLGFRFEQLVFIAEQLLDELIDIKDGNEWKSHTLQPISCQTVKAQSRENFKES